MPSLQKKCNEAQKNNPRGVDKFFFKKTNGVQSPSISISLFPNLSHDVI